MKTSLVRENIEFQKSGDIKKGLGIGIKPIYVIILDEIGDRSGDIEMAFSYDLNRAEELYSMGTDHNPDAKSFLLEVTGEGFFKFADPREEIGYYDMTAEGVKLLKSTET